MQQEPAGFLRHVDVASQFYSYSFDMRPDWSEYFPRREEIHDYFERCADRHGIREHIRFRTEVTRATWDETASNWLLELKQADLLDQLSLIRMLEEARPHEVYNLAAQSFVPTSFRQPVLTAGRLPA